GVKTEYQNKGVGTLLLNKVFKEYKNYFSKFEYIFVKTLPTVQNLTYYKKSNFLKEAKIVGRIYLKKKI
ncbi:GNAT family N-acetyltransferase, partial [Pelagibacteraceae bacterium]|nr:GNAT family N-acetyltransferase [Pelagibacteraceae bacterium]